MTAHLTTWKDACLGWIYPNWCQICDRERAVAAQGYVGEQCRRTVKAIRPPFCGRCGLPFPGEISNPFVCADCRGEDFAFEYAQAAVVAGDCVREVLHRYKYHRALWLEPCLTQWLVDAALPILGGAGWTCLVPVPLHPVRKREREFNQASRLACGLGKALKLPVREKWVIRTLATPTQTNLNRSARAANVRHAFAPGPGVRAEGESVIVVDDILTTGATTHAVASVLRRSGASRVCVWTVARAVR